MLATAPSRGIQVGARLDGIAAGPDAVWVANSEDGMVQRIDPAGRRDAKDRR
jgi:hypothetical protein